MDTKLSWATKLLARILLGQLGHQLCSLSVLPNQSVTFPKEMLVPNLTVPQDTTVRQIFITMDTIITITNHTIIAITIIIITTTVTMLITDTTMATDTTTTVMVMSILIQAQHQPVVAPLLVLLLLLTTAFPII